MKNSSRNNGNYNNQKLKWLERIIEECFSQNVNHSTIFKLPPDSNGQWCPPTFDGFACWDATPPAATAVQHCPEFIVGFDPKRFVYKSCTENGTWYIRPDTTKPWTNYTTCIDMEDLDFRSMINNVYVAGYSVSVAALLVSLMIFIYFSFNLKTQKQTPGGAEREPSYKFEYNKLYRFLAALLPLSARFELKAIEAFDRSLQCTRIRIHKHLFTSFALNNIMWIVWYKTVVNEVTVVQDNEGWCQVLHIVTNYFMVTSFFWMFCEGLHLHIALVVVFVKDEVAMRWFAATGWGLSLVVVAAYAAVRYHIPGATERCWMDQSDAFWIIVVPVVVSLLSSFVFLVNVVRVLLTKLHPAANQHARLAARKAARAALILIPLFGLHFILIPLHPKPGASGEKVYQVVSALLSSLQGLCVAVLFCFTNHEVMAAMRTHAARVLRANDAIALTGLTAGESLVNTRENVV